MRQPKLGVTRSRAYKKNGQAFVEQKNGAVVRRLMGYGRFDGLDTAHVMGRLYAAATLRQLLSAVVQAQGEAPRRGQGDQALSCSVDTLSARAGASKLTAAVKRRLHDQYRSLNPVALLAEIRAIQEELGNRADRRVGQARGLQPACTSTAPAAAAKFAKALGKTVTAGEPRATHRRRRRRPYKTRVRTPSKLDPHFATIEGWLIEEPQLNAVATACRLSEKYPDEFGTRQYSIVQRLLRAAQTEGCRTAGRSGAARRRDDRCPIARGCGRLGYVGPDPPTAPPTERTWKGTWRGQSLNIGATAARSPSG